MATSLAMVGAAVAQIPDTIDGHVRAAQRAAEWNFPGTLDVLCIQSSEGGATARSANAATPRPIPAREIWYAEPAKVSTMSISSAPRSITPGRLRPARGSFCSTPCTTTPPKPKSWTASKAGLDPATIKYVIVSHGHGDHDEGAKMLQDRYGARIIMGEPDWDTITKAGNMPGGVPKRDIVASDGQKVTLGDTTVTILLTPGHTLGTLSFLFPVKDQGKTLQVAYSGGMGFNFPRSPERFRHLYRLG